MHKGRPLSPSQTCFGILSLAEHTAKITNSLSKVKLSSLQASKMQPHKGEATATPHRGAQTSGRLKLGRLWARCRPESRFEVRESRGAR